MKMNIMGEREKNKKRNAQVNDNEVCFQWAECVCVAGQQESTNGAMLC